MKKLLVLVFLIGITSIQYAANQIGTGETDIQVAPGASRSLVLLDARVTDESGNYVQGLQAEDFEVYQDGRLQEIAKFYAIERRNSELDPQTVVFVIDDLGLSKAKFNQVRTALKYFADKIMSRDDLAAIAQTSGAGFVLQPLTSDNEKLRAAASRWQWCLETARPFENMALASRSSSTVFVRSCSGST